MRTLAAAATTLALLMGGGGCTMEESTEGTAASPCSAETATATTYVRLASMQFAPFCVTIPPGAEITFSNVDAVDHTVTADAGQPEQLESGLLRPGGQFTHRFSATPETVRVHCRLYPQMSGVVIVR